MKTAFLFAGQGSQCVGMGQALYGENGFVKESIDLADKILPELVLKTTMFDGPDEKLKKTGTTQPALASFAAGVTDSLYDAGVKPDFAAGLSLGEYSSLYAAGVFDKETLFKLTAFRGAAMEQAAEGIPFRMSAVLGLEEDKVKEACKAALEKGDEESIVEISNLNSTGQVVIAGREQDVMAAEEAAVALGAKKCMPLKVGGPFHTSYMKPAGEKLKDYFEQINFGEMKLPVVFNVTGKPLEDNSAGEIKKLLVRQVSETVRMTDILKFLESEGVKLVIEIGPGKTIAGFIRRTCADMTVVSISDTADLENAVRTYNEMKEA